MNEGTRRMVITRLQSMNLIADGYELPRESLQAILQRLADNVTELQRRSG